MEPQIRYTRTSDGVDIAYYAIGSGPPLMIMEPATASNIQTDWAQDDLRARYEVTAKSFTLIRFDPRGFGLSRTAVDDFTLEGTARDIEAIAEHLSLPPFSLMAMTHASLTAIHYAHSRPERLSHLIIDTGLIRGSQARNDRRDALLDLAEKDWPFVAQALVRADYDWKDNPKIPHYVSMLLESTTGATYAAFWRAVLSWDVTALLPEISTPTLVISSNDFPWSGAAREFAASIPGAQLKTFKWQLAEPEYPPEIRLAIDRFLLDIDATQPEPTSAEAAPLPSGTAIIMFTDIVASTAMTEQLGDTAFRDRARDLDDRLRAIIREHSGLAIDGKLLGDGVLATFASARDAIAAAMMCSSAGADLGLELHLGLHAGDVIRERDNVFGGAVNLASRIASASAPGEVLVSDIVRGLARTSAGVEFEDRGEHALKGIAEPQRLFAVRAE
jgi:class 3 adenylate cyclase